MRGIPTDPNNRLAWLNGGSTSIAFNVNRYLGIVGDFGGYRSNQLAFTNTNPYPVVNASGTVFTYMAGPRFSYRRNRKDYSLCAGTVRRRVRGCGNIISGWYR